MVDRINPKYFNQQSSNPSPRTLPRTLGDTVGKDKKLSTPKGTKPDTSTAKTRLGN